MAFDPADFLIGQAISTLIGLLSSLDSRRIRKFKSQLRKLRDGLSKLPLD